MFEALCFCTCTCICLSLERPTVVTHHAQIQFFIFLWSRVGLPSILFVLDCTVLLILIFFVFLYLVFLFFHVFCPADPNTLKIEFSLCARSSCINPPPSSFLCLCFQLSPFLLHFES